MGTVAAGVGYPYRYYAKPKYKLFRFRNVFLKLALSVPKREYKL